MQKGKRYRFRLINAVSHACPVSIEVQGHNLTVLSSDSFDLRPETVERLISNSGERYDFVVDASQCGGNFWIRVTGVGVCDIVNPLEQYAILTYDNTTPIRDMQLNYGSPPPRNEQLNHQQRVSRLLNKEKKFYFNLIFNFHRLSTIQRPSVGQTIRSISALLTWNRMILDEALLTCHLLRKFIWDSSKTELIQVNRHISSKETTLNVLWVSS